MVYVNVKKIFVFFIILFSAVLILQNHRVRSAQSVNITATVNAVCGNEVLEIGEQCDGSSLGGQSCASRGYAAGSLSCNSNCIFNTAACTISAASGGGGGGGYISIIITQVTLTGRAYPLSKIVMLKDGQAAATTIAGPDAKFNVSLTGLSSGDYTFSVYGEDINQRRSTLFTFPVFITQGVITNISGIFIAPTIAVDKSEVKKGDNIAIFGQSAPSSDITIGVASEEAFVKIKTDEDGAYLYDFDTASLEIGAHATRSKSSLDGQISSFSKTIGFKVGAKTVLAEITGKTSLKGDLNNDGKVNLIDFSIAAYWYKQALSAEFKTKEAEQLNGDGKIDIVDFSIMAYYWTG